MHSNKKCSFKFLIKHTSLTFKGSTKETSLTCGPVKHQGSLGETKESSNGWPANPQREEERGQDLVLLDTTGKDTTPLWTVRPGATPKDEPFGNWVPHLDKDTAHDDKKIGKKNNTNQVQGTGNTVLPKSGDEISVDTDEEDSDVFDNYDFNESQQAFTNKIDSGEFNFITTGIHRIKL